MRYKILNSGSDGNAIIINDFLLLDCGISFKRLSQELNKIKLIFISHVLSSFRPFKHNNN